ncbi:MAG: EamA family transporter, partial [Micromonosporaceae bacterium]
GSPGAGDEPRHGGVALAITTGIGPAIWGSTYLVTTEFLPPDRPLLASAVRALPAGLALTMVAGALPRGDWWWRAAVLGTLNIGAFFPLLFYAAYHLPGGVAAVVGALGPFVVAGLAYPLLGQVPTVRTLLAAATGVLGVCLLVLRSAVTLDGYGLLAMAVAIVAMAVATVLGKRWGLPPVRNGHQTRALLALTGWQLSVGGLLLVPLTLLGEGVPESVTLVNLAGFGYFAVVGAAVAYLLWFRGVARLTSSRVSILALLSPVVAAALGWIVLGQALTVWQLVGALLVLGAVAVGSASGRDTG